MSNDPHARKASVMPDPWRSDTVNVLSDKLAFRPRLTLVRDVHWRGPPCHPTCPSPCGTRGLSTVGARHTQWPVANAFW
jgi:hypothetical protein